MVVKRKCGLRLDPCTHIAYTDITRKETTMTDEQRDQHANEYRPSLEVMMSDKIDEAMDLADDPDYAAEIRGWDND